MKRSDSSVKLAMKLSRSLVGNDSLWSLPVAVCWHLLALSLVLLAPSQLWLRRPVWSLTPLDLPQCFVVVAAYLAFALFLHLAIPRRLGIGPFSAIGMGVLCFVAASLFLDLRHDLARSRALLSLGALLGIVLALSPFVFARMRVGVLGAFALLVVGLLVIGKRNTKAAAHGTELVTERKIRGAMYMYDVRYFNGLVRRPLRASGGAIVPYGAGFLLSTGDGDFYSVAWKGRSDTLTSAPLKLVVPTGRTSFSSTATGPASPPRLRVTDILLDTLAKPTRLIVGHVFWNQAEECVTLRVSALTLDAATLSGGAPGAWTTIFTSKPCLKVTPHFDYSMTGGRLAWTLDHALLFSTGDFDAQGIQAPGRSQTMDNDYGKILQLDQKGGSQIFSLGLRNPEGLTVSRSGRIWETEHGPQGGDEVNLITKGANYGWPLVTYGTEYGLDNWPLSPYVHDHGSFTEPSYVFVPSIGISNVIELHGPEFPKSDGDLLISSLVGRKLFRARVRGDRIIYAKEIPIDRRIRDLAQGPDGRIVLWTDEGDVVAISAAPWDRNGQELFGGCAHCHTPTPDGSPPAAPTLNGILGRDVASVPGFAYSHALRALPGTWSRERLEAFIADPDAIAPGTPMASWRVQDAGDRARLMEYLVQLK